MVSHVEADRTIRLTRSDPCQTAQPSLTEAYTQLADLVPDLELAAVDYLHHSGRSLAQMSSVQPLLTGLPQSVDHWPFIFSAHARDAWKACQVHSQTCMNSG